MRIIIAGLVAGVVVFVWGTVMHMVLPIGSMGLNYETTSVEPAVLEALGELPESGIYLMPGQDASITDLKEQMKAQAAAWKAGPSALIVLQKDGGPTTGVQTIGLQFLANVIAGSFAAMILGVATCGYMGRVVIVGLMGLFTFFNTDASYWIWFGFGNEYTLVQCLVHSVGWLLAGIIIGAIMRPGTKSKANAKPKPKDGEMVLDATDE